MSDRARPVTGDHADAAPSPDDAHGPTRRTVLRAAGLAALAGGGAAALAACSSGAGASGPTSAAPASGSAAAPSATAGSSASSVSGAASVSVADVPVGGGVILKDANYVITQPTKGDFKAFSKICTHMGCPVAEVAGGSINCKCHGSKFSIKDGSVVNPPASKPLAETPVTVSGDKVVVDV
jgi:Rieske Fe-S protein